MAKILVCEPHSEVRSLLGHVVGRLGHEVVFPEGDGGAGLLDAAVDVLVIEPADPRALAAAQILRLQREDIPVAYLVKPFALGELEAALHAAVGRVGVAA